MRNLKRVLSLALATVMLLGMMVIGAGAADAKKEAIKASDLTDMATVVNKDAVALMVDLGIVEGKPDKTYDPKGIVDRATMAKLVYKVLMGTTDEGSFKGVSTPLTDIKGNWAEGFINYCFSVDIVAGVGDGKFNPSGKVTVASAAKMLLVALGYDAKLSKYEGDAMWSVNIMRDAQKAGLLAHVTQGSADELTRDNAAQMIYNALFARKVVPVIDRDQGVAYLTKYDSTGLNTLGLDTYGLAKATFSVGAITAGKAAISGAKTSPANEDPTLANVTAFHNKIATAAGAFTYTPNMVGTSAVLYIKVGHSVDANGKNLLTFDKVYSTTPMAGATTVLGTSTNGTILKDTSWAANDSDLVTKRSDNKSFIAELEANETTTTDADVKVFLNGAADTSSPITLAGYALSSAAATAVAKLGTVVELIDSNDNGKADIIKITEKKVYTLSADASTKVVGTETQVRVPGFINSYSSSNTTKTVVGYEGLVKDDVILVATLGGINYIEKAAVVEGIVTGTDNNSNPKMDGVAYKTSGLTGKTNGWDTNKDYTNTYKFYLDNGKNIVKTVKVTATAVAGEYAIPVASGLTTGDLNNPAMVQGKFLLADGTTVVASVAKVNSNKITAINELPLNVFYTYTVNDKGAYEITTVTKGISALGTSVLNNTQKFDTTTNLGSADTTFLVQVTDGTNISYKLYKGIAAVPAMSTTSGQVLSKDGIATLAYVQVGLANITGIDSDAQQFYIPSNAAYSYYPKTTANSNEYYEYVAYVNGDKSTVKVNEAGKTLIAGNDNAIFSASTKTDNGVYTNVAKTTEGTGKVTVANGGTLTVSGDVNVYKYDEETKVYLINGDKQLSLATLKVDATDTVTLVLGTGKYVKALFVRENISNTTGFAFQAKTKDGADAVGSKTTVVSAATTDTTINNATAVTVKADKNVKLVVDGLPAGATLTSVTGTQTLVAGTAKYDFTVVVTAEDGTVQTCVVSITFAGVTAGT